MQEWTSEAYWDKAKDYIEAAFNQPNDSFLFPLLSTFGLEFLGKAALAKIHPVLVADPRGEGRDILYAFGVEHKSPTTIMAKTVFNRLYHLIPDYTSDDEDACLLMADFRNTEVHSGAAAYAGYPNGKWLPDFFRVVVVLVNYIGRPLEELLGGELAIEAITAAEGEAKKVIAEVKKKIAEANKGVSGLRPKELADRQSEADVAWSKTRFPGSLLDGAMCPACRSKGRLRMVHVRDKPTQIIESEVVSTEIYAPRAFECKVCGLNLDGVAELRVADLADLREFSYSQSASEFFQIEHEYESDGPEYEYDNE